MTEQWTTITNESKKTSHIGIVLDSSGSMSYIRNSIIKLFNEQLQTIKTESEGIETKVSLITFSGHVDEPTLFEADLESLNELTEDWYHPSGNTALNDAVANMITRYKSLPESENNQFLVLVFTDGEENASVEYSSTKKLAELIKPLEESGKWTFVYSGANVDVERESSSRGIRSVNTQSYTSSVDGVKIASANMTRGFTGYYDTIRKEGFSGFSGVSGYKGFFADPEEKDV